MTSHFVSAAEPKDVKAEPTEDDEEREETFLTRFIARLMRHFLKGFVAKDKNVRYRCVQFVAEMIAHLGEIEYVHHLTLCHCSLIVMIQRRCISAHEK